MVHTDGSNMAGKPALGFAARGYVWATVAVAGCTAISALLVPYIDLSNADALYLLAVLAVAARYGRGPAVYTSALGIVAFDCFIVPPTFGFVPEDAAYLVTFAVMLVAALTVSAFAAALREQVDVARERLERTTTLYDLAADLARAADPAAVARVATEHVREVFRCKATVLGPDAQGALQPQEDSPTLTLAAGELEAARAAMRTRTTVGPARSAQSGAPLLHTPLVASDTVVGVLSLEPMDRDRFEFTARQQHLQAFADQTASAVQRAHLAEVAERTRLDVEQERLRNTLLHSVSHDLRTPLAAIQGAASTILQSEAVDADTRRALLRSICDSSERLGRRIHKLLEVTRLESGTVRPRLEWTPLDEVVGAALTALEGVLRSRRISVDVPSTLPPIPLDGLLAQQVIMNLVENANRHAPGETEIGITARQEGGEVVLDVSDRGPGVRAGAEEAVFLKFHQGDDTKGVGLGLAIVKAIMDLHHGRAWVEAREGGGARFRVAFPCRSADLAAPPP